MYRLQYHRSRSGSRAGVALILALAFILLLTILIVSYISFTKLNRLSTTSYSKSIQAQEIAQGGLQDILGDLHQEIIAGSINNSSVYTQSSTTIYVPTTNLTAVPARAGYAANLYTNNVSSAYLSPTLIRVSRASQDSTPTHFYPSFTTNTYFNSTPVANLINRASAANSTTSSIDGRTISAARWNKIQMLSTNSTIPPPFATNTPDWVYVTRSGSRVCTVPELASLKYSNNVTQTYTVTAGQNPPASPVVGRYAFVMYDESALLDANVAGYTSSSTNLVSSPANATTGMTQAVNGKSYLSYADLTQLPGLSGNQSIVDNFVEWRNASVVSSGNSYLLGLITYAKNGFLNFQTGDSPFLGRQDLINYFANIDPNINTATPTYSQALPYLGTFSRAISAPTYAPPLDPSATPGYNSTLATANPAPTYHTSMEITGVANRDLANVRFANAGTITHYSDDATITPSSYAVNIGDPLLQNRFSLAKINWLSQADPNAGTSPAGNYPGAIQSCFGLTWGKVGSANGGNPCWSYVGSPAGSGASAASFNGTIETLDQVAKEGREPNFFEMLKAAILSGSLGQNPGKCVFTNGNDYTSLYNLKGGGTNTGPDSLYAYSYDKAGAIPAPCQVSDMQIMKIGADIIDQYDADSYPTAIYFKYQYPTGGGQIGSPYDATTTIYGPVDMIYGDENLPELMGFYLPCATVDGKPPATPPPGSYGTTQGLSMWWQPEIWNPHAKPNPANGGTMPSSMTYVIQGYGQVNFEWLGDTGATPSMGTSSPPQTLDNNQIITFTDSSPTTSAFYAQPLLLTQTGTIPNVTVTASDPTDMMANSSMEGWSGTVNNGTSHPVTQNHFVGFWAGNDPTYTGSEVDVNVTSPATGTPLSFCLGWKDSGGGFHPYSYMPGMFVYIYGVLNNQSALGGTPAGFTDPLQISASWHAVIDPRTQRFSSMCNWTSGWVFPAANTTLFPVAGEHYGGFGNASYWVIPTTSSFVYDNTPTKAYPNQDGYNEEDWEVNSPAPLSQSSNLHPPTDATYYSDPDGVVRPGDGLWGNWTTGDGMLLFTSAGTGGTAIGDTTGTGDSTGNDQHGRRSIILNRPFRSVGELGYVFRDLPFKTLDFFSASSADAALLDVFSLTDESKVSTTTNQFNSVVAGQFNPSNAPLPVIEAVLSGGNKKDFDATYNLGAEAATSPTVLTKVATSIVNILNPATGPNPLLNRAALVTQMEAAIQYTTSTTKFGKTVTSIISPFTTADQSNKAYLESPVRAMSDATNTRTWNLLIDIIAQSGQMASSATSLDNFVVQGERRYWLHVAIDRYTGKIISQQLEPVYE